MDDNMSNTNYSALDFAIRSGAQGSAVLPLAKQFAEFLAGDAPKATTRGRKSKDDSAPADGAASEPSSPNASQLEPADEAKGEPSPEMTRAYDPAEIAAAVASAAPSRDDVLTAATKFSQAHGADALMAALKDVGAAKFSEVPAEKYQAFLDAMAKKDASASALS